MAKLILVELSSSMEYNLAWMIFSSTFERMQVKLIGRQLDTQCLSPFYKQDKHWHSSV